jgi:zinc transport system substrate-binding protein
MSRKLVSLSVMASLMGGTAIADVPRVAVDIAPVHSLVARVMERVGTPDLIIRPGASPHEYSLRPSEAAALQEADLVFWMGEDLTPWMEDAVVTLAADASVTTLLEAEGTTFWNSARVRCSRRTTTAIMRTCMTTTGTTTITTTR